MNDEYQTRAFFKKQTEPAKSRPVIMFIALLVCVAIMQLTMRPTKAKPAVNQYNHIERIHSMRNWGICRDCAIRLDSILFAANQTNK